jgi:hypothetical protein
MKPDELVDTVAREMTSLTHSPQLRTRVVSRLHRAPRWGWRWTVAPIGVATLLALALWLAPASAPQSETPRSQSAGAEIITPTVESVRAREVETPHSLSEGAARAPEPARLAAAAPASDRLSAVAASMDAFEDEEDEPELPLENAPPIRTLQLLNSPEPLVVALAPAEALSVPTLTIAPIPSSTLIIPPLEIAALPDAKPDGAL